MLMALAFVPVNPMIDAFEKIIKSSFYKDNSDILNKLIDYFKSTRIGKRSHIGFECKKPLFDIWNCYQAVIEVLKRSNNSVEGWHHSFNNKVRVIHAIFSCFISIIKAEQVIIETTITQIDQV